mgnify:CR=1 FL=1
MEYQFVVDLENFLRDKFEKYPAEPALAVEACPAGMTGDFALNCFRIGRFCGNPMQAAAAVAQFDIGGASRPVDCFLLFTV